MEKHGYVRQPISRSKKVQAAIRTLTEVSHFSEDERQQLLQLLKNKKIK